MSLAFLRQLKSLTALFTAWHLRWLKRIVLTAFLLLLLAALAWQFVFIPRLNSYKPWIEQQLSQKVGATVQIAELQGSWRGIRPQLALLKFRLSQGRQTQSSPSQRSPLEFDRMEGTLSWWHLLVGQLRFSHLRLHAPELDIVRLANGQWQVAGLKLDPQAKSDGQFFNWLLNQGELTISNGAVRLQDEQNRFPALYADRVQLNAENWFGSHQLVLRFMPRHLMDKSGVGKQVDIQGRLSGDNVNTLSQWSGWLKVVLPASDLLQVSPWLSPLMPAIDMKSGYGALALTLELDKGVLEGLEADVQLSNWRLLLPDQTMLSLPLFDGKMVWRDRKQQRTLQVYGRQIQGEGIPGEGNQGKGQAWCERCELEYTQTPERQTLTARRWQLQAFNAYRQFLPEHLAAYRSATLGGYLKQLSLEWPGQWPYGKGRQHSQQPQLDTLQVDAEISQLSVQGVTAWPAIAGLDLTLNLAPKGGQLKLGGQNVRFDYPAQFLEPLQFGLLQAAVDWRREGQGWQLNLDGFKAVNTELELSAQGQYRWPGTGMGQVDLNADIRRLAAQRVYAYLPRVLSDEVLVWLKGGLLAGDARNGRLLWRGDVAQFPYTMGTPAAKAGQFMVQTEAKGVTINYADGWPMITQVDGQVLIDGMQLTVAANQGQISGTALDQVKVTIPNLEYNQHVLVDGKVSGQTADFLRYVENSPVRTATHGFLDQLKAQGRGQLDLQLDIPIEDVEQTRIKGLYAFDGNQLDFGDEIPVLNQAKGAVSFTETSMKVQPSTARALGGTVQMHGETNAKGELMLNLKGQAELEQALRHYLPPLSPWLQGMVAFQGQLQVDEDDYVFNLNSDLQGAQSHLPVPLNKSASQSRAFRLKVAGEQSGSRLEFAYGKTLQAALLLPADATPVRGQIVLGSEGESAARLPVVLPQNQGIQLSGRWPQLNLAEWLPLQSQWLKTPATGKNPGSKMPELQVQQLAFDQLYIAGQQLDEVRLQGQISEKGVQASLASQQIVGDLHWLPGANRLDVQLSKLWLPLKPAAVAAEPEKPSRLLARGPLALPAEKSGLSLWQSWPALNLQAQDFRFKNVELGTLRLSSQPQGRGIDFKELSLSNADGQIALNGQWFRQDGSERTQAKVAIDSPNLGNLLKRLGYPEAMKQAPLTFRGDGQWRGAPWSPDWPTAAGQIELNMGAGQFSQLDPGVGRFMSILSLQALPRRLKLDFSDVFSGGFEFDEIHGTAVIEQGIAKTNNLKINGPAAKVRFTGDANFVAGTQHLRVRVVPSIGGAVALGVAVVNPIIGLATLAAQSALDNPLGELVAYEFQIDGSMADPQIKKIGVRPERPFSN
ncbi:YhdP family protein [Chitinibacter sp. GC72]|uniref:YhdP family protein n=1 Tax=Chitinibacter sp. GC72 TaxID=1526917 RepID=UPI0012FA1A55|nr:YhdP family protein [Chitinibacter sp. GC72]